MKKDRERPAVQKAISFLKENIRKQVWMQGERLPAIRVLADKAGVSLVSMVHAVNRLKSEQVFFVKPQSGIFIGTEQNIPPRKESLLASARTKKKILEHIMHGVYRDNESLPGLKELTVRYSTTGYIIKKVLRALVSDEILLSIGRKYAIRRSIPLVSLSALYFIISPQRINSETHDNELEWLKEFTGSLESECAIRNIQLRIRPYKNGDADKTTPAALGVVVWLTDDIKSLLFDMLHYYLRMGCPVCLMILCVLDDAEYKKFLDFIKGKKIFVLLVFNEIRAGFQIGRFLVGKGHRKICYFSYEPGPWTNYRHAGIMRACETTGVTATITHIDCSQKNPHCKESQPFDPALFGRIKSSLASALRDIETSSLLKRIFTDLRFQVSKYDIRADVARRCTPFFKKALDLTDHTIWICEDEFLAHAGALPFLQAHKVKVPDTIGLLVVDDQTLSLMNNLTAYHFNFRDAARQAVSSILYTEFSFKRRSASINNTIALEGYIVDRGSV